jgi:transcriptional regulator with XRE-family HTH domain
MVQSTIISQKSNVTENIDYNFNISHSRNRLQKRSQTLPPEALNRAPAETPAPLQKAPMPAAADLWLGIQVRDLRKQQGLSLQQLATRASVSVGMLSQIERGLSSPSIRSLRQISEALGVTPSRLFSEEAQPVAEEIGKIVRRDKGRLLRLPANGVSKWLMTPELSGALEMLLVVIEPGGSSGPGFYNHVGEECGYVISGAMRLWIDQDCFLLKQGDSFRFASKIPHRFESAADGTSEVLWIITPPLY